MSGGLPAHDSDSLVKDKAKIQYSDQKACTSVSSFSNHFNAAPELTRLISD